MSAGGEPGHLHPVATKRSGYAYFFYDKHHGRGGPEAAQWASDLDDDEEFGIFDRADLIELSDEKGNLYGISIGRQPDREVRYLGTLRQQIAKFPLTRHGAPWHGYPLGPLELKLGQSHPPERRLPKGALQRMVVLGLLDNRQRLRLLKGRNI